MVSVQKIMKSPHSNICEYYCVFNTFYYSEPVFTILFVTLELDIKICKFDKKKKKKKKKKVKINCIKLFQKGHT